MKTDNPISFVSLGMVVVFFLVTYLISENKEKKMDFSGVIKQIRYSDKGFPFVTIKNKEYYFSNNNWSLQANEIHVGDSIVKKRGELSITVYIKSTGEYKIFNNGK